MSLGIGFGDDGKVYGLLYPMGGPEQHSWELSFYHSERGRKMGIRYLQNLLGSYCPLLKFELTLAEIKERGVVIPFIPKEKTGNMEHVVKPEFKYKGQRRPKWRDN